MMGRALLVVGLVATVGFVAAGVVGYGIPGSRGDLHLHLLIALVSSLLLLFSHCWIMFYLIGTGKAIKEAVAEHSLDQDAIAATQRFKRLTSGWASLAMALAMATFILGGGVYTGAIPRWVHHSLFYLTLGVQGWAVWREAVVLAENDRLMADINHRLEA